LPSKTVQLDSQAKKMILEGQDIINLGSGEPEEQTSDNIKAAAITAIQLGKTKYSDATGLPELKGAILQKLKRDNNLKYNENQVVVSSGAKHAIFNSLAALLNPGDEVIIPAPYWVTYPSLVKLLGGIPVIVSGVYKTHYKITPRILQSKCSPRTKCVIFNSPCNPTGAVYTGEELAQLGEVVVKNDLFCISDEIYEHLIYDGTPHVSMAQLSPELYQRTVVVNGVSKAYAMTGYRIGYSATSEEISRIIGAFQSQSTHHPSTPAQYAAAEALNNGKEYIQGLRTGLTVKRELVFKQSSQIDNLRCHIPQGAFYFFMDVSEILAQTPTLNNSDDLCEYLLNEHRVATVPGSAFGMENTVRISFTTSIEALGEGVIRIAAGLSSLV